MVEYGSVALILLFGIGFAMYVGTIDACSVGSENCLGIGFISFINFLTSNDINAIIDLIIGAVVSPAGIGALGAVTVALILQGQVGMLLVRVAVLISANILFVPFTFASDLPVPLEIQWFIRGTFFLLMLLATISYTTGRDF